MASASSSIAWEIGASELDDEYRSTPGDDDLDGYGGGVGKRNGDAGKKKARMPAPEPIDNSLTARVGRIVGTIWSTRQTIDDKNGDLRVKTTIRELIIYVVFLIILCVMTFGMMSSNMFNQTNLMTSKMVTGTFDSMLVIEDWWSYVQGTFLPNVYPEEWYNQQNYTSSELGYLIHENKLLGVPRFRQLRVRNNSCTVPSDFQASILTCYDTYSSGTEDTTPFGDINGTAWTYQSSHELKGSSFTGAISSYGGDGYVQDLSLDITESTALVQDLMNGRWIDRGTRAVFIDLTVYNANINLFCVIRLLSEFPSTGGVLPYWTVDSVKLLRYVAASDFFILSCEIVFALFLVYYIIEEAIEIKKHKLQYFKSSFWNIVDIVVIVIGVLCVAFDVYRTQAVGNILENLLQNPDAFPDFQFLTFCQMSYNYALAVEVFICWVKIFKYLSFNKTMTQLSSTLSKCGKDLGGFAIMFFIFFLAFAQLGYLLFGTQMQAYNSVGNAVLSLFRLILGDFDFTAFQQANRVLGPAYFVLFVFFVFFILLNMFLAIINDTYAEVKSDQAEQQNEIEMGAYFKQGAMKMMDKLNIKREKIIDLQGAMKTGDKDGDGIIDFLEWKTDMKARGYGDQEIETVFAKYDTDGSRCLNADEQRRMEADLNRQKDDVDSKLKTRKPGVEPVSSEELNMLQRRVDNMDSNIDQLVQKIDTVLTKLDTIERAKTKRKETMGRLLDSLTESDVVPNEVRREQIVRLVKEEMQDCETDSGDHYGRPGLRSRARPASGQE